LARVAYRTYVTCRESEIRNSYSYLPNPFFKTRGSLRSESTMRRYERIRGVIAESLGDQVMVSVLDIGCNEGYFSLRLAAEGFWVTGIDGSPDYIGIANFLQLKFAVNKLAFYELTIDKDILNQLPTYEITIFMSVFQKWCSQYGYDASLDMLKSVWSKTNRIMFFEMPDSLESVDIFKKVLPDMGETKDKCKIYITEMLRSLDCCSVTWLGDHEMDYRVEQRSLFAVTRTQ